MRLRRRLHSRPDAVPTIQLIVALAHDLAVNAEFYENTSIDLTLDDTEEPGSLVMATPRQPK